ncbi:hypothetical protein [Ancylobacter rudongensis]|uniref:Uncharacterized protein n=1 Tax=Ancylobacter rudongensis TaxID=177413 RepID=A0A1G4UQP2_9HYPH|nr:hypothetical protein [Ancylobacter rudongensis]SCW95950.1 hypothetical protein SAMN05660859_0156 [Ancylobacter rudongensis]
MRSADDWPSHAEELGRKSLEVLEKWMKAYNAGKITRRELYILVSGLYDAISGLAPNADLDVIGAVHQELRTNG